jgi:membrane protease YdiL (CAAX protease family)
MSLQTAAPQLLQRAAARLELTTAEPVRPLARLAGLFVVGALASVVLQPVLAVFWRALFDTSAVEELSRRFGNATLQANPEVILMVAAIGPVIEEFIFRWGAFKLLKRLGAGTWTTIAVSAAIFALAHWHVAPAAAAFAGLVGLLLGYLYARTNDIWCAVATHAGINAGALSLMALGALLSGRLGDIG